MGADQAEIDAMAVSIEKAQREREEFTNNSPLRERVSKKFLNAVRRKRKDPAWRPFGMLSGGGMWFELRVDARMRRIWGWQRARKVPNSVFGLALGRNS